MIFFMLYLGGKYLVKVLIHIVTLVALFPLFLVLLAIFPFESWIARRGGLTYDTYLFD